MKSSMNSMCGYRNMCNVKTSTNMSSMKAVFLVWDILELISLLHHNAMSRPKKPEPNKVSWWCCCAILLIHSLGGSEKLNYFHDHFPKNLRILSRLPTSKIHRSCPIVLKAISSIIPHACNQSCICEDRVQTRSKASRFPVEGGKPVQRSKCILSFSGLSLHVT